MGNNRHRPRIFGLHAGAVLSGRPTPAAKGESVCVLCFRAAAVLPHHVRLLNLRLENYTSTGSTFGLYDTGCLADYSTSTITRQGGVGWLSVACASPHSLQFLFFIWLGTDACFACGLSTYNWYLNNLALIWLRPERGAPAGTPLHHHDDDYICN